jgi:hypothetical protein
MFGLTLNSFVTSESSSFDEDADMKVRLLIFVSAIAELAGLVGPTAVEAFMLCVCRMAKVK